MKKGLFMLTAFAIMGLCACGSQEASVSSITTSSSPAESSSVTSKGDEIKAANLVQAFSSPAVFAYNNMRPAYNYYTTTFAFETLDLYDDNTYQFNIVSMTFSGVVLPEEGNDGSGNERENSVTRYYGTYTAEEDELDEDILNIELASPGRVVVFNDASEFYDTANWTATMSKKAGTTYSYDENYQRIAVEGEKSALEYLKENVFTSLSLAAVTNESKIDFEEIELGNDNAKLGTYSDGLNGGYSSPAVFAYNNNRPTYNYYTTTFAMQTLETYADGKYIFNQYSSTFSGVVLPEEGSDGSGNERENSQISSYGTYTSEVDDLDEDTTHISLSASTRLVVRNDASEYYDTANWTAAMSKKAGTTYSYDENYQRIAVEGEKTAAEYLAEKGYAAKEADVVPTQAKLDYLVFA